MCRKALKPQQINCVTVLRVCSKFVALADLKSVGDSDVEFGCCAFQQLVCAQAIA